jgi:hypothetical protein
MSRIAAQYLDIRGLRRRVIADGGMSTCALQYIGEVYAHGSR